MFSNSKNINEKTPVTALQRAESKTARKFKAPFGSDALPQAVSVTLDWFSCMVECGWPDPVKDGGPIFIDDDITVVATGKGTPVFNHSWEVYQWGEKVAMFHTHSKNEKIIKAGTAKVELSNNILYSSEYLQILQRIMDACNMPHIKNLSRVDIAIDGANHVHQFLNAYIRQRKNALVAGSSTLQQSGPRVRMKGKAALHARMFNKRTGMFDSFKIGSARKNFVLYCKSKELERSHKEYIRQVWEKAGLDPEAEQWRCELRMSSEAIKEIKDFDIKRLSDPNYLLQIYKTQCENFVHFVDMEGQTNVTYARTIDLFQFEKLRVPLLQKLPRALADGAYKAKMAIHNAVKDIILDAQVSCNLRSDKLRINVLAALQHVTDNINIYNLRRWYDKSIGKWEKMYLRPGAPPDTMQTLALCHM